MCCRGLAVWIILLSLLFFFFFFLPLSSEISLSPPYTESQEVSETLVLEVTMVWGNLEAPVAAIW